VSNTTVAAELEDLQTLITGRPDSPDHTAESPARPKCRPPVPLSHALTRGAVEIVTPPTGAE
jgi:hypothetical protein